MPFIYQNLLAAANNLLSEMQRNIDTTNCTTADDLKRFSGRVARIEDEISLQSDRPDSGKPVKVLGGDTTSKVRDTTPFDELRTARTKLDNALGVLERRLCKPRKEVKNKPSKRRRAKINNDQPTSSGGVSPETAHAIGTMIDIGIGIGLSRTGGHRNRGDHYERGDAPRRVMPKSDR